MSNPGKQAAGLTARAKFLEHIKYNVEGKGGKKKTEASVQGGKMKNDIANFVCEGRMERGG